MQQLALTVQTDHFASGSETGIDGQDPSSGQGRSEKTVDGDSRQRPGSPPHRPAFLLPDGSQSPWKRRGVSCKLSCTDIRPARMQDLPPSQKDHRECPGLLLPAERTLKCEKVFIFSSPHGQNPVGWRGATGSSQSK